MESIERTVDFDVYGQPDELCLQLNHKDVWLGYFMNRQRSLEKLVSEDDLKVEGDTCFNRQDQPVLKFSQNFCTRLETLRQKGYNPQSAKVNFIVYWKSEKMDKEVKIILPELTLLKVT